MTRQRIVLAALAVVLAAATLAFGFDTGWWNSPRGRARDVPSGVPGDVPGDVPSGPGARRAAGTGRQAQGAVGQRHHGGHRQCHGGQRSEAAGARRGLPREDPLRGRRPGAQGRSAVHRPAGPVQGAAAAGAGPGPARPGAAHPRQDRGRPLHRPGQEGRRHAGRRRSLELRAGRRRGQHPGRPGAGRDRPAQPQLHRHHRAVRRPDGQASGRPRQRRRRQRPAGRAGGHHPARPDLRRGQHQLAAGPAGPRQPRPAAAQPGRRSARSPSRSPCRTTAAFPTRAPCSTWRR